jgi:hypothetical protein
MTSSPPGWHVATQEPTATDYSVGRHGTGWAIYRGRDLSHHGCKLGQLTECDDALAATLERALNGLAGLVLLDALSRENAQLCEQQEAQAKELAALKAALRDPVLVHAAMLRNEIARPAVRDMLHAHGEAALAQYDRGALRADPVVGSSGGVGTGAGGYAVEPAPAPLVGDPLLNPDNCWEASGGLR